MSWSRRRFLNTSLSSSTLVAMGSATIPTFIGRSAEAARGGKTNERILVVVQLLGGNDGLNTVVPHGIDGYSRGRRALRLPAGQLHKITPEIGLHPAMGGMAKILERGRLAVVQGVGYPNPDRSHFRSMEIWESASLNNDAKALETGWLGRALDSRPRKPGDDPPGLHVGAGRCRWHSRPGRPRYPRSRAWRTINFSSPAPRKKSKPNGLALNQLAGIDRRDDDPLLGFISRTTLAAYESSGRLEQLSQKKQSGPKYPNYGLARRLELIAQDYQGRLWHPHLLHLARRL